MTMNAYVVYKYKNSIHIKYGRIRWGTFYSVDGETWMTHIPDKLLVKQFNKVVVESPDQIPRAIELLWGNECKPCKDEDKLDKLEAAVYTNAANNVDILKSIARIEKRLDALEGKRSKSTYGDKEYTEFVPPQPHIEVSSDILSDKGKETLGITDDKETYKRSGTDGFKTCPYCGGNWNMTHDRMMRFYDGPIKIRCGKCKKIFTVASFDKQKSEYVYIKEEV